MPPLVHRHSPDGVLQPLHLDQASHRQRADMIPWAPDSLVKLVILWVQGGWDFVNLRRRATQFFNASPGKLRIHSDSIQRLKEAPIDVGIVLPLPPGKVVAPEAHDERSFPEGPCETEVVPNVAELSVQDVIVSRQRGKNLKAIEGGQTGSLVSVLRSAQRFDGQMGRSYGTPHQRW